LNNKDVSRRKTAEHIRPGGWFVVDLIFASDFIHEKGTTNQRKEK